MGKNLFFSLFTIVSLVGLSAFAENPENLNGSATEPARLNSNNVILQANPATLVRTSQTPTRVQVSIPVQMANSTCVRYDTRMVFGQDASCGYETYYQTVCHNYNNYPYPGEGNSCHQVCEGYYGHPVCHTVCTSNPYPYPSYPVCEQVPFTRMRSCDHPESYCAQQGVVNNTEMKSIKLVFRKRLPTLNGSQEETFELKSTQEGTDSESVNFTLEPKVTQGKYKIRYRTLFGKRIVVKP